MATRCRKGTGAVWEPPVPDRLVRSGPHCARLGPSPDGKTLAIGIGGDLTLWDIDSGRAVLRVAPAESAILSVAFSPDGKHLVRVDRVKVAPFDAATGREGHAWDLVEPQAVAFLPGSSRFVVTVGRQADWRTSSTPSVRSSFRHGRWSPPS